MNDTEQAKIIQLWKVAEAANEVLGNLIDAGDYGPEVAESANPIDREGSPWYSDLARLCVALDQLYNTPEADRTFTEEVAP